MRMGVFTSTSRRAVATASPDTSARTAEAKTLRLVVLISHTAIAILRVRLLFAEPRGAIERHSLLEKQPRLSRARFARGYPRRAPPQGRTSTARTPVGGPRRIGTGQASAR